MWVIKKPYEALHFANFTQELFSTVYLQMIHSVLPNLIENNEKPKYFFSNTYSLNYIGSVNEPYLELCVSLLYVKRLWHCMNPEMITIDTCNGCV